MRGASADTTTTSLIDRKATRPAARFAAACNASLMGVRVYSLIERVQQRYATAIRYSDRGTALVSSSSTGQAIVRVEFETLLERANQRFSFSCVVDELTGVPRRSSMSISANGCSVSTTSDPPTTLPPATSLDLGIAALTGVSFGSAQRIPHLLMPEQVSGSSFFESPTVALRDPTLIEGMSHHAIAMGDSQWSTVIFVNEVSLLVRRVVEAHTVTDYIGPELMTVG